MVDRQLTKEEVMKMLDEFLFQPAYQKDYDGMSTYRRLQYHKASTIVFNKEHVAFIRATGDRSFDPTEEHMFSYTELSIKHLREFLIKDQFTRGLEKAGFENE